MDNKERKRKEKILTNWFHAYIRLRDTDRDGNGHCISCGRPIQAGTKQAQAGHFYPKVIKSLKWDEKNVNLQCNHCNRWLEGNKQDYAIGLMKKYGQDILMELKLRKARKQTMDQGTLDMMIKHYKKAFYNELKWKSAKFLRQYKNGMYKKYAADNKVKT